MVANIHTGKLIETIKAELNLREVKIQALSQMIDSLEEKINKLGDRLDTLSK
jgi:prefoldin subunit 5